MIVDGIYFTSLYLQCDGLWQRQVGSYLSTVMARQKTIYDSALSKSYEVLRREEGWLLVAIRNG